MWTINFWKDAAERAIKTASQAIVALWFSSDVVGIIQVDLVQTLSVAGLAAAISILTSVGSEKFGTPNSASVIR